MLWSLVHKSAPFVILSLGGDSLAEYSSIRQYRRVLSVAKSIGLQPRITSLAVRRQSSDKLSITCISFRFILSSLSNPSSLQTLVLRQLKVVPAHQRLILSIPTLRKLVLEFSEFIPTSIALPTSSITTLCLGEQRRLAAVEHTLTLLANSLETLEFSNEIYHLLANIPLPRLTSLTSPLLPKKMVHFSSLSALTRLSVNIIGDFHLDKIVIDPTVLPNLHYLCTWWTLGALLIAGRPVRVFRLPGQMSTMDDAQNWLWLVEYVSRLASVASHLEELQIPLSVPICETIEILIEYLPRITRLHLWSWEGEGPPQVRIRGNPAKRNQVQHPSLKEVVISFTPKIQTLATYPLWRSPGWVLPRAECNEVFETVIGMCAMAEVVRIGALMPWDDEKDIPPEWIMEMRKAEDGTWVERK